MSLKVRVFPEPDDPYLSISITGPSDWSSKRVNQVAKEVEVNKWTR